LAAGTRVDGAQLWRLAAGRRGVALLAAGKSVLAAAMWQWQREAGRLPPTKNGRMREDGELPQTNAATAAISVKRFGM